MGGGSEQHKHADPNGLKTLEIEYKYIADMTVKITAVVAWKIGHLVALAINVLLRSSCLVDTYRKV